MDLRPQVVSPAERFEPQTQQTSGIHRQQAFAGDDRWVGFVRTEPGDWSGWHHHGEHDTYFFVLQAGLSSNTVATGRRSLWAPAISRTCLAT
jgi:hypothetical protein